jgi:hypothetical protein
VTCFKAQTQRVLKGLKKITKTSEKLLSLRVEIQNQSLLNAQEECSPLQINVNNTKTTRYEENITVTCL